MGIRRKLVHLPTRLATGAFILDQGLGKLSADDNTSEGLHGMAKQAYPFLGQLEPKQFTRALALCEVALGGALLAPVVPEWLAGLGLSAFSGGLVGLYLKTPDVRQKGSVRPSPEGIPLAKDVWMLGIGLSLVLDGLIDRKAKHKRKHDD